MIPGFPLVIAQEPSETIVEKRSVRELHIPFDDLNVLLGGNTERVFMTRQEYEQLLSRAKKSPDDKAPLEATILRADYVAKLEEGRAAVTGNLTIDVLNEGLHAILLELAGVGIRSAQLDGMPAPLAKSGNQKPVLLVEGIGRHQLTLEMIVPVNMTAALQALTLQLPVPPAVTFRMTVPGNVEVKSGAAVIGRQVDEAANVTNFEILPARGSLSLVLSLNNRQLRDRSTVVARSVVVDELTSAYEKLHATLSMSVLHGAVDEFRILVPDDFEVTTVATPLLSRWLVELVDGRKELVVSLRETALDQTIVNISAVRIPPPLAQWKLPKIQLKDVAAHTSVIGLLVEEQLATEALTFEELIPIESSLLIHALPESVLRAEPGAPTVRPIAAYYAANTEYSLSAQFRPVPKRLNVTANLLLTLSDSGLEVNGGFALLPEAERLFSFDFTAPLNWQVDKVTLPDGTALKFERFDGQQSTRFRVQLPSGLQPGVQQDILFHAERAPPSWLSRWDRQNVVFPAFTVLDAARQEGAVAVQVEDDLEVTPTSTSSLIVLSESELKRFGLASVPTTIAYRYDDSNWSAALDVTRTPARLTGRVMSFFAVQSDAILAHFELAFDCQRARTQQVSFSLPDSTPAEIALRGLSGTTVKEISSTEADGKRTWVVSLAEKQSGRIRLAIDFTQRLVDPEPKGLQLPIAVAEGVAYQSGLVAVEGNAELDIAVVEHPKPIDVGELVDAEYQVGKRLLGAYGYVGTPSAVRLDITRRPVHPLPSTVVQRAELATLVSASGTSQTSARFQMRTKAQYLEIQLPDTAVLWTMLLDGKPALPQRQGDKVIIALPTIASTSSRDLRIVYEMPNASVLVRGDVEFIAPKLLQRETQTEVSLLVPIADLKWELILPEGYRVVHVDGNVFWEPSTKSSSAFGSLLGILYRLGGGTEFGWFGFAANSRIANIALRSDMHAGTQVQAEAMAASERATKGFRTMDESEQLVDGIRERFQAREQGFVDSIRDPFSTSEAAQQRSSGPAAQDPFGLPMQGVPELPPLNAPIILQDSEKNLQELSSGKKDVRWAMEGIRSLAIDFSSQQSGERIQLESLGFDPRARVTLINQRRLEWFALAVGLIVALIGMLLLRKSTMTKTRFVALVVLLALLLPPVTGLQYELVVISEAMLIAACVLTIVYLLCSCLRTIHQRIHVLVLKRTVSQVPSATRATAVAVLLFSSACSSVATAQNKVSEVAPPALQSLEVPFDKPFMVNGLNDLLPLLEAIEPKTPLAIPQDAIVVPYNPGAENPTDGSQKLLVPYSRYVELWNLAYPDKRLTERLPPAEYAISGAKYATKLEGDEFLSVTGELWIENYVDKDVTIPLMLDGGVLERANLDGQSARLELIQSVPMAASPAEQPSGQRVQAAAPAADAAKELARGDLLLLHVAGKGRKHLTLSMRMKLERRGGWRAVEGRIPSSSACSLSVSVPTPLTEVRLGSSLDRSNRESSQPDELIETVLASDGALSIQWRPKITEAVVDQGLSVQSRALFDIQEDGQRLVWKGSFEFRRSRRESLSLKVPSDYLVEKVSGANVRGWLTKPVDGGQQVDVDLLKAASDRESITIALSRRATLGNQTLVQFEAPVVSVPDAMLHQGEISIRRSTFLDVRAGEAVGLRRTDSPETAAAFAGLSSDSPLPLKLFQSYQFSQTPFALKLSSTPIQSSTTVELQTLLKIAQRDTTVESRLVLDIQNRPLHRLRIGFPPELEFKRPFISAAFEWNVTEQDGRKFAELYFSNGLLGSFQFVLLGSIKNSSTQPPAPPGAALAPLTIPRIEVLDVQGQQGDIVVQADPAFDVRSEQLSNCEVTLIDSVAPWLDASQRASARAVIHFGSANYDGLLRVTSRAAVVSSFSVSNVKLTDRAIEETIYLEFTIRSAGIREINFVLPGTMRDARVQVPLLRQKTVTPINADANSPVRFRLELQDDLMGQVKIVVENDTLLTAGPHEAPVPVIETGRTDRRFITLENVGSSELLVGDKLAVEALDRSQSHWKMLASLLGEKATEAFMVREGSETPKLTYDTKVRAVVETSGARIALAQTLMVVDASGAYRAVQEYRIENRTEQYLEVIMPGGAQLWTAWVAGEPVKPMTTPAASGNATLGSYILRIPLVKTATGDLDYGVVLKYGGLMSRPGGMNTAQFPLIRTGNINVELSQVRLRLPQSQKWFNFGGTMGRVLSESDLTAGWLSYRTRQISELTQLLDVSSKVDSFSQARASNNLKQLGLALHNIDSRYGNDSQSNVLLQRQLVENSGARLQAEEQLLRQQVEFDKAIAPTNRDLFNEYYANQDNARSLNTVQQLGNNFSQSESTESGDQKANGRFDRAWFEQNQLEAKTLAPEAEGRSRFSLGVDAKDKLGKLLIDEQAAAAQPTAPEVARSKRFGQLDAIKNEADVEFKELDDVRKQTQRYQQRLEQQNLPQQSLERGGAIVQMQDSRGQAMGGMGGGGMGMESSTPTPQSGGFRERLNSEDLFLSPGDRPAMQAGVPLDGDVQLGAQLQIPLQTGQLANQAAGYLASLDVEFPVRGQEFMFTTVRGETELTAQSFSTEIYDRLIAIATVLTVMLVVWLALRTLFRQRSPSMSRGVGAILLMLAGLFSLIIGILPIYGCLAILVAIGLALSKADPIAVSHSSPRAADLSRR